MCFAELALNSSQSTGIPDPCGTSNYPEAVIVLTFFNIFCVFRDKKLQESKNTKEVTLIHPEISEILLLFLPSKD